MARGVGAVITEVVELVDVESVAADIGVTWADPAIIGWEVVDSGGDLRLAFFRTVKRFENLSPTVGSGVIGRLEDGGGAAVLIDSLPEEVELYEVDPAVVVPVESFEAFVSVLGLSVHSINGGVV